MFTRAAIFERIKTHLLTQNQRALEDGRCVYSSVNNLKCAVGCLILSQHYSEELERFHYTDRKIQKALKRSGIDPVHFPLVYAMARIHDKFGPEEWGEKFERVAKRFRIEK